MKKYLFIVLIAFIFPYISYSQSGAITKQSCINQIRSDGQYTSSVRRVCTEKFGSPSQINSSGSNSSNSELGDLTTGTQKIRESSLNSANELLKTNLDTLLKAQEDAANFDYVGFYKDVSEFYGGYTSDTQDGENPLVDDIVGNFRSRGYFDSGELNEELLRNSLNNYYNNGLGGLEDPNTGLPIGAEEKIDIEITPYNPKPGDTVTIKVTSLSRELGLALFRWSVNGQTIDQGKGKSTLEDYKLGNDGRTVFIDLYIQKDTGGVIERKISIIPSDVDLIFEPNTYVPPFFPGKSFFTHQSQVKFIAIPTILNDLGQKINNEELEFTWSVNNGIIPEQSGIGKNTLYYNSPFISVPINVYVKVRNIENDFTTTKSIYVRPVEPLVLFYEDNPIYGVVYNKAISNNTNLNKQEVSIKAIPFSFNKTGNLKFTWYMNNSLLSDFNDDTITLRNEGSEGKSGISLQLENRSEILQIANKNILLNFKK